MWVEFDCRKDNNTLSRTCSLSTEQNGELLSSETGKLNLDLYRKKKLPVFGSTDILRGSSFGWSSCPSVTAVTATQAMSQ